MEQRIQYATDAPLLQRVSKVRECMGLEVLPAEVLARELDPLLSYLLRREEGDNTVLDLTAVFQVKTQCDEKWSLWDQWSRWAKNNGK